MKTYPRLRIYRHRGGQLYNGRATTLPGWRIALLEAPSTAAIDMWAFDYDHACQIAPAIWTDRALWVTK